MSDRTKPISVRLTKSEIDQLQARAYTLSASVTGVARDLIRSGIAGCRERGCTPHVSQNDTNRRSAIDARTTRHSGYRISTIKRKRIEEPFGWIKTVGGLRKTQHRGRGLVEWFFVLTAAAYNLVRIPKILAARRCVCLEPQT
jgi:hypothetical protein